MAETTTEIPERVRMWLDRMLDGTGDTCESVLAVAADATLIGLLSPAGRAVLDGWRAAWAEGVCGDDG